MISKSTRIAVLTSAAVLMAAGLLPAAAPAPWRGAGSESPIADAEMRGDTARVRQLLKQGADVNAAQGDGMTALHWAAVRGDADQAQMLIYAGARLEALTRNGHYTPLHLATRAGKPAVVKALAQAGANTKATTTSGGATPLHFAAEQGSVESIVALIEHGAPVNARDSAWGQTPLMWAAAYNRVPALQALLARGADIKATSKVDDIAAREKVDRAAITLRNKRIAAIRAAEQPPQANSGRGGRGAGAPDSTGRVRPDTTGKARGDSSSYPSDSATKARRDSTAKARRDSAAKTRGDSAAKRTPADSQPHLIGNKGGLTALLFAIRDGNAESVMALLKAGADVNQVSAGDHTSPLLMATINGRFDLAKQLLERGANPKLASDAGATPLYATINIQWAPKSLYPQPTAQLQQQTTHLELMEALLKAGADPNVRLTKHLWYMAYNFDLLGVNTTGATPFWRAAYGTDVPAMRLLIKYGADPTVATIKPPGGRVRGDDAPTDGSDSVKADPSGLPPIPEGGPGVFPIHAASGVGYGEGYAANAHQHAPDSWLPAMKYLIEELHADVNARDHNGNTPLHHAAARGDNQLIEYLVSKGADVTAVSRKGQTTADMANGPVSRIPPFPATIALLEKLGSKNNHKCKSC